MSSCFCSPSPYHCVPLRRYCIFGTTVRLAMALQHAALPMSVHVSEMVYNRVKATGDPFVPFTNSSFSGVGIIRTLLVQTEHMDAHALQVRVWACGRACVCLGVQASAGACGCMGGCEQGPQVERHACKCAGLAACATVRCRQAQQGAFCHLCACLTP